MFHQNLQIGQFHNGTNHNSRASCLLNECNNVLSANTWRRPGMSPFTWNQSFLCSHTTLLLYVQSFCVAACLSRCLSIFLHTCLALQFIGLPPKGGLEDGDREGALNDVFKSGHCATIYYKYRGSSNSALSVQVCPFLN